MPANTLVQDLGDGSSLLVSGFDDDDALASVEKQLRRSVNTPTPSGTSGSDGGPASRVTNSSTVFGINGLRTIGLQSHELGDAIRTRRDELYRNEFPKLKPRFTAKCVDCETELDRDVDECPDCGSEDLRRPDPAEKRAAKELFESVNREGQSLRELAKYCEVDQWVAGVSMIVIQYDYTIAHNSALYADGEVIAKEPDELVYGDPNTIVPVVDEDNRAGGYWWTCPIHREDPAGEPGRCERCNAELQEVFFVEKQRGDGPDHYYFRDEVVTWAHPMPRLGGLDGLAPTVGVVLRQVILEMMNRYGAAFYDQESDRLPNQLMILHTTNVDKWREEISKARDDDDPYDSPILANEYSPQDSSTPSIEVVDAMPDELLGQSSEIKQDYKEDIRQAIGISNVHDSDLSDAGGLNNEGLQLEVTDRAIASQQHDYVEGWLDTLAKRLGIDDWYIDFLPATGPDAAEQKERVRTGALAAQAGLDARWEDGEVQIDDGEFEAPKEGGPRADIDGPLDRTQSDDDGDGGETGNATPAAQANVAGTRLGTVAKKADDVLYDAHRHIIWASDDVEQQAEPFFDEDEAVPEFVIELVQEALNRGALSTDFETLSSAARGRLADVLEENLTQPQGWSLRSISTDLQEEFNLTDDEADTVARNEVKAINDQARELAYEQQDLEDEAVFKWLGPVDDRKHEACEWLLEKTNPDHGGTPRPLDELRDLVQEANRRFVDGHEARRYSPHIGCRDTYVQHYDT